MAKERQLTRRSFLATTALTAGALATAGAAGCTSVDTSGEELPAQPVAPEEQIRYNVCRAACGNTCSLRGRVRDGKLVQVGPTIFPREYFGTQQCCVKGQSTPARVYADNRVLYPMLQKGERGSDNWERVSWDEAIALIAEKFQKAIDEYGEKSVCFWVGAGINGGLITSLQGSSAPNANRVPIFHVGFERFISKIGATVLNYNADMHSMYFGGTFLQSPGSLAEDLPNSKLIIFWGCNLVDAWGNASPFFLKAKEAGAKIIDVNPVYTNTTSLADIWVPIRQGTDGAMMLAMANYIIDNDLVDHDYLSNKSVAPFLLKEDGKYLRLSDLGMEPDEDGSDSPVVWDEAAGAFGSCLTVVDAAVHGTHEVNGVTVRTVYDMTLEQIKPFTVEFAAQECGVEASLIEEVAHLYATTDPAKIVPALGIQKMGNAWRLYLDMPFLASLTGNMGKPGAAYNAGFVAITSAWKTPVTTNFSQVRVENPKPNLTISSELICEIMETGKWVGEDFPVRCIYHHAANPLHSCVGTARIKQAYDKVDFIVVADSFMTDTASYADLVLPIAMSWESEGHNGTIMLQKAVEPAGESWTDFDVFKALSDKMGLTDVLTKSEQDYLREILDTPENIEAGVAYDDYKDVGMIPGDYVSPSFPATEPFFGGRTRFHIEEIVPRDDMGQKFEVRDLMPFYEHALVAYPGSPLQEKYPFYGITFHENYHLESAYPHNPLLDEFRGSEPTVRIHADAAAKLGIEEGDVVRVYNDNGSCVLKAFLTQGIRPDTITVPHGYYGDEFIEGHSSDLATWAPDPVSSNSNSNEWFCAIEKVEGGAA